MKRRLAVRRCARRRASTPRSWTAISAPRARDGAPRPTACSRATEVLRDRRRVRENYHMIDDEFQFAILASRWLADPAVPAARKRAFLADESDGEPRLHRLL